VNPKFPITEAQVVGIDHLTANPRALLWAGCGAGKSRMVLEALGAVGGAALIVSPKRVSRLAWPAEVARWAPHLVIADVSTKAGMDELEVGAADVYLIHYDVLQKFASALKERLRWRSGKPLPFETIVFDELTKAKSPSSKRIRAIRPVADSVARVWGLTGTPAPNSLLDVWGQVRIVDRGERLGTSYHAFRQRFFYPQDYRGYTWHPHPTSEDEIHRRIADIALVMRTSDWLDMPDLDIVDHAVALPADERRAYATLAKNALLAYDDREITGVTAAVLINKLAQFTGGAVYDDDGEPVATSSAKVKVLRRLFAGEIDGPALVLVAYRHHYETALAACPSGSEMFDGSADQIDRWNAGAIPALVANPASIGHGLNLQAGGRDVVWYNGTWSSELYDQSNARLWRQGQTRPVRVHRLIVSDSVDERLVEVLRRKDVGQSALLVAVKLLHDESA